MAKKRKPEEQDEQIIELTDVVEEGDLEEAESLSSAEETADADLDKELDDLFAEEDTEEQLTESSSADASSDEDEDDLDLDALFDELDRESSEYEPEEAGQEGEEEHEDMMASGREESQEAASLPVDDEAEFDALLEGLDESGPGRSEPAAQAAADETDAPVQEAPEEVQAEPAEEDAPAEEAARDTAPAESEREPASSEAAAGLEDEPKAGTAAAVTEAISRLENETERLRSKIGELEQRTSETSSEDDLETKITSLLNDLPQDAPLWSKIEAAVAQKIEASRPPEKEADDAQENALGKLQEQIEALQSKQADLEERVAAQSEAEGSQIPQEDVIGKVQEQIESLQSKHSSLEEQLAAKTDNNDLQSRISETLEHLPADHPLWNRVEQCVSEELERAVEQRFQELSSRLETIEERLHKLDELDPDRIQAVSREIESLQSSQESKLERSEWQEASSKLKEELREEIEKAVPAAAATIIREEIQALSEDLDEEDEE